MRDRLWWGNLKSSIRAKGGQPYPAYPATVAPLTKVSFKNSSWVLVFKPVILATWGAEIRRIMFPSQPRKEFFKILFWKYPIQKRVGRVAYMVECLPTKREVLLSSNPNTTKKKKSTQPPLAAQVTQTVWKLPVGRWALRVNNPGYSKARSHNYSVCMGDYRQKHT
jgi:hypothetical protein